MDRSFRVNMGISVLRGGVEPAPAHPAAPGFLRAPSPSTPRLLSHLPEPPPRGITPGKNGENERKRENLGSPPRQTEARRAGGLRGEGR